MSSLSDTNESYGGILETFDKRKPRIMYVVNADWYFLGHRLPLAKAARDAGAEVWVVTGDTGLSREFLKEELGHIPFPISRKSLNPFNESITLGSLLNIYRKLRPDLVHNFTIKPVIYSSLASRIMRTSAVVNTVSGLGYTFTSNNNSNILKQLVIVLWRAAFRHPTTMTIFENPDDRKELIRMGILPEEKTILILGAGVDCRIFRPTPEPDDDPVVMLASRMLWDKGIKEFVDAARLLRKRHDSVRFVLVGKPDPGNPTSVSEEQLKQWDKDGVIEWWGHRDDMSEVLSKSNVVVLPSYREGVPRIMLEAAASCRALVATDVPGCREIVRKNVNGFLVPPKDSVALADSINTLLLSPKLRTRFGQAGRKIVVEEFEEKMVIQRTLDVYHKLLKKSGSI